MSVNIETNKRTINLQENAQVNTTLTYSHNASRKTDFFCPSQ